MLSNHVYNLMLQLTEESKSLQRMQGTYLRDAEGHEECVAFWKKMISDKEGHISELMTLVKNHL